MQPLPPLGGGFPGLQALLPGVFPSSASTAPAPGLLAPLAGWPLQGQSLAAPLAPLPLGVQLPQGVLGGAWMPGWPTLNASAPMAYQPPSAPPLPPQQLHVLAGDPLYAQMASGPGRPVHEPLAQPPMQTSKESQDPLPHYMRVAHRAQGHIVRASAENQAQAAPAHTSADAQPSAATDSSSASLPAELPRCHLHKKPSPTCKKCKQVLAATSLAASAASSAPATSSSGPAPTAEKATFNCSPILKDQILKSTYFKSLLNIGNLEALIEEIINYGDGIDLYQDGSATAPSVFICSAYRIFTLEPAEHELRSVINHFSSALVRCVGFIYLRLSSKPDRLWDIFEEYVLDNMKLESGKGSKEEMRMTIGDYVEALLMKEKYFGMPLPRLPVVARRKLEEHIAPLPQYRKRAQANQNSLKLLGEEDTAVEVCLGGSWQRGQVLELERGRRAHPSRPKLRVQLDGADADIFVHIGRVVLCKASSVGERGGRSSRSRSRSRDRRRGSSPDWLRWKGKSDAEMVRELRERTKEDAVCASGKEYSKRPYGFETGLALRREQGSQESRLMEEDTFQGHTESRQRRRANEDEDDGERERQSRRKQQEEGERQRKLAQIFEKYGGGGSQAGSAGVRARDVEGPDVMRLG